MRWYLRLAGLVVVPGMLLAANGAPAVDSTGVADDRPLPQADEVVEGLVARVEPDAEARRLFQEQYAYVKTRVREVRTAKGQLKSRKEEREELTPENGETDDELPPGPKGRAYDEGDLPMGEELIRRFDYRVEAREEVEGRELLRVSFRPSSEDLPAKGMIDRFINRTAGTVWVQESDFAFVRARMALTKPVKFLGGLAGMVHSLDVTFERAITPEGIWYTLRNEYLVDYRILVTRKVVSVEERRGEVRWVQEAEASPAPGASGNVVRAEVPEE